MSKTIDFIFDFASPNGYLAHKVLGGIAAEKGAGINIIPCLLGGIFKATGNQAPMVAFGNVPKKMAYEMLEMQRYIEKHSIPFKMNPNFPINTLHLMRGLIAAQELGVADDFITAVSKAMWGEEKNMDDASVVAEVLTAAGLPAEEIFTAAQTAAVKDKLKENTTKAVERGVFGVPTFFVGEEMFFGKDRLGQVVEALG